ncbi:MAG: flagellar protein FlgN [Woeseiaceae bacterium]
MSSSTSLPSLINILSSTQDKVTQLLKLLLLETKMLEKNDIEALETITLKKVDITEQLEKSDQQRIAFLTSYSLNPDNPQQWLKTNEQKKIWQEIKTLSIKAQKQNQINGQVINGSRNRIQSQIQILNALPPSPELTYSAKGANIQQHTSNTLARA